MPTFVNLGFLTYRVKQRLRMPGNKQVMGIQRNKRDEITAK